MEHLDPQHILNALPDALALVDTAGSITFVNESWRRVAQANDADGPTREGVGASYFQICERASRQGSADAAAVLDGLRRVLASDAERVEVEYECHSPSEQRWFVARITPVWSARGPQAVVSHVEITRQKVTEFRLRQEAEGSRQVSLTDQLTGLRNRRAIELLGREYWASARRHGGVLAVVVCDLDDFKPINDTHGHQEGDRALRFVADYLRRTFRNSDVVARVGGDEFVVLAWMARSDDLDALRARVQTTHTLTSSTGVEYSLAMSVGCAVRDPRDDDDLSGLINRADALMYEEKRHRLAQREDALAATGLVRA